jgi:hypothetical protein
MPPTRYRARLGFYVFSVIFFAALAGVALLSASGYTIDLKSGTAAKTGLLVLDSQPSGASITVNGKPRSERTGARLKLFAGTYQVKVEEPGTAPWEQQVRIEPGQAVINEHIRLFTAPATPTRVAEAVTTYAVAPNGRRVAWLAPAPDGIALQTAPVADPAAAERLATLPADFGPSLTVRFSPDSSRLLVSSATRSLVNDVGGGQPVTLPLGGRVQFAPGRSDIVLFETPGSVLSYALSGGAQSLIASGVAAWQTSSAAVYLATTDRHLIRFEPPSGNRKTIALETPLTELTTAGDGDAVFGRDTTGTFYAVENDTAVKLGESVDRYAVTPAGDRAVYLSGGELSLWKRSTGQSSLITRLTTAPHQLALLPGGYYLLYLQGTELHSLAVDGTNDLKLAEGVGPITPTGDAAVFSLSTAGLLEARTLGPG